MTEKDYVLIAGALWHSKPLAILNPKSDAMRQSVYEMCVRNIADALAMDNPRSGSAAKRGKAPFDRERFLKACGVQS